MQLNIKYFGLIAEITQCSVETFEFSGTTIYELKELIFDTYPELIHKDFQVAQDQEIVSNEASVSGKELALLPPFSGG